VDVLQGDPSKAKKVLRWEPKIGFKELAKMMTDADMKLAKEEKLIKDNSKD
jgi:GDPmannose 4,6-dehydratase